MLIVYLFVSYAHVNLCHSFSSSWYQELTATSACGSSWTFLFTFFNGNSIVLYYRYLNKITLFAIIPTSHDCTSFEQFDWLKEKFYNSINSVSKNLGTTFFPSAFKIHNYFDTNEILIKKLEL